ncbi:MAG TPA: flagellar hook-basal body complex protein, partial [Candidatus Baltobacteraceae bacterium]|nr:flagellar hook-basal body complex protein [Candidatus Baltobacteraceae bacterium]
MAFDSLFTGISGLNAYQSWIDMLSNNIANTATTGFKGQRMTFADMFYQQTGAPSGPTTTSGGVNPIDNGLGVKVNTVDTQMQQGGFETTGVNTDLAINGDGFFILRNVNGSSQPVYTRDGAFSLNSNGLLYDPGSGLAVQGYMANQNGQVTQTGTPGDITVPIGLSEQATATGQGVKVGPALNDQQFDVALGGNLDQTQWSQQFLNQVGASINTGTPKSISTTVYDSLGNAHQATITYTPDAAGSAAATGTAVAGTNPALISGVPVISPAASQTDNITVTQTGANTATISDTLGNSQNVDVTAAAQTVTMGGATFTIPKGPLGAGNATFTVNAAKNGLPTSVQDAQGQPHTVSSRWKVSVAFTDGTQFQTLATAGSINGAGAVTAPVFGTGSSGDIGFAYFDQNGQFINTSSIETVAAGQSISPADATYLHTAGGGSPNINQGNQLNVTLWGPSAGNNASAPTAGGAAPTPGPIALDFSTNASLAGAYTANVISQNGYAAGVLSNITVGQDGTVTGSFTNGQQKALAQVALAVFQNEQGLQRLGGSQFAQTAASGLAQIGIGTNGRYGSIASGSLEQSNVNLADQFTKLIVAQRAFEANSRGITTAD